MPLIISATGSSFSDSQADVTSEALLLESQKPNLCKSALFLLGLLSSDPVLLGGRVLRLADGAAALGRELATGIVRVL